ncbi:MAG: cytochrome c4 [Rhodobacteraceae bacterium]|nr:cytochrome c4 [Paracoccaceae bacterium]
MRLTQIIAAAILTTFPAFAQDAEFDVEDEAQLCIGCHGEQGLPIEPDYPIIHGQEYFYIYTQLRDYGAGRRQHDIMTDIASAYDRDQAKALAQYFADLPWPAIQAPALQDGDQALSEKGITGGQCSACHGKWDGDSRIPRLAGQQPAYLEKTMLDFKNEIRMNAPDKISTMKQLDDATIEALSRYLAAL